MKIESYDHQQSIERWELLCKELMPDTIEHWNNIIKKLREEARKLKEQEAERLKLLQETDDFISECDRNLDYMEKIFFIEDDNENCWNNIVKKIQRKEEEEKNKSNFVLWSDKESYEEWTKRTDREIKNLEEVDRYWSRSTNYHLRKR